MKYVLFAMVLIFSGNFAIAAGPTAHPANDHANAKGKEKSVAGQQKAATNYSAAQQKRADAKAKGAAGQAGSAQ